MTKLEIIKTALAETGHELVNATPEQVAKKKTKAECERFAQWLRDCAANCGK